MKQKSVSLSSAEYISPSVRVIALRMKYTILAESSNIYNTPPAETEDQDVF